MQTNATTCSSCFTLLRKKHKEWTRALSARDPNGVENQIYRLLFDVAMQRMLSAAWQGLFDFGNGPIKIHPYLTHALWLGVRDSAILTIGKITEKQKGTNSNMAVHSLHGVLDDMKGHAHLLTRANMLRIERLLYRIPDIRFLPAGQKNSRIEQSEMRHKAIDALTRKRKCRRPEDSVPPSYFDRQLKRLLGKTRTITNFRNKYIGHAATKESRRHIHANSMRVDLNRVIAATQLICEVFTDLRIQVLGGSACSPLVGWEVCRTLKKADGPAVPMDIVRLQRLWEEIVHETEGWFHDQTPSEAPSLGLREFVARRAARG